MAIRNEEQTMLVESVSAWCRDRAPVGAFRALRDTQYETGFDQALYTEMAEMGLTGVLIPEEFGGVDFGYLSMGLVAEELGRHLTTSPLISTAVGGVSALLLGGSDEQKARLLPEICAGQVQVALGLDEGAHHAPESCNVSAVGDGDGWRLSGHKTAVLHGNSADFILVSARTAEAGITLFLVPTDLEGVIRRPLIEIDVRGACLLELADVKVGADALVGPVGGGLPLAEAVLDRIRAVSSAEMLGSALQAFETTMEYLKTREQFGRLIGSFQALQHRAANMLGELELTRTAVESALCAVDDAAPDLPALASVAKSFAGDTLKLVTAEMIQMHGGIGMTDEHDAGLYYKRAFATDQAFGSASYHRERYARLKGY